MGIDVVAFLTIKATRWEKVLMTSTLSRTNSAASSEIRSSFPCANRYSMWMVRPSTYPRSRSACWNPSIWGLRSDAPGEIRPTRGSFSDCCGSADLTESRIMIANRQSNVFLRMGLLPNLKSAFQNQKSFDDPVRPRQHIRRNREAVCLARLEIGDKLELHWLLELGDFGISLNTYGGALTLPALV